MSSCSHLAACISGLLAAMLAGVGCGPRALACYGPERCDANETGADMMTSGSDQSATSLGSVSATDSPSETTDDETTVNESTGGAQWAGCATSPLLEERFDSLPLDPEVWDEASYGPASADLINGTVRIALNLAISGPHHAHWGASSQQFLFSRGVMGLEVVAPPQPRHAAGVYVAMVEQHNLLFLSVGEAEIRLTWWDAQYDDHVLHASPYDHVESRWIRMAFDRDVSTIAIETSPDGESWNHLDTVNHSMTDWSETWMEFGAGAWYGPVVDDDFARLDNVFLCTHE
jgi:hypothetical protein